MMKLGNGAVRLGLWIVVVVVVGGCAGVPRLVADDPRPNIVFIFSDDHAYQAIGAYGSRINQTPHLDRLAAAGMKFNRCLVTNSICGPSRATILTGKYSHRNGFFDNSSTFDGDQITFPKLLQAVDYQSALFGKWHLRSKPTGFDHWSILLDQGEYYNPDFLSAEGKTRAEGYVTDVITDRAVDWLKSSRDSSRPFLLMVQHKAPHREWSPGPNHLGDGRDAPIPEPETLFDDYAGRAPVIAAQEMTIARHMRMGFDLKYWSSTENDRREREQFFQRYNDSQRAAWDAAYEPQNREFEREAPTGDALVRWKYQRYMRDYLGCIASVDDSVGQLLQTLDELKLAQNTVVVYSSDQGFYLGEHGWYDKRWIFEESLRTPLIVRWPGVVAAGTVSDAIVSNLDFAPTFLEIAGAGAMPEAQGRSLVPILQGRQPADWRTSFYYHYYELTTHHVPAHFGVVTDRYKLVCYYQTREEGKDIAINQWELMDLQENPQETRSYLDDPAYGPIRDELYAELKRHRAELGLPGELSPLPVRQRLKE